jgi:hypothetical protein
MHVFSTGTVFSSVARKKTECQNEAAGLETSVRRAGLASLCYTCATHSISATLTKQSGQCMCRVPYSQSSRDWRQNMPDTPYLCEDRVCTICLEQCDKPFTAKCGHALCNECVTELARNETHVGREPCCPMCRAHLQFKGLAQVELARGIVIKHFKPRVFVKKRKWHWTSSVCKKQCWL